jgi:hypothetical protein
VKPNIRVSSSIKLSHTTMILLLGNHADESVKHIGKALSLRDISFVTVNTKYFIQDIKFSYSPNTNQSKLKIDNHTVETRLIKSAFWIRVHPPIVLPLGSNLGLSQNIIQQEANCFLQSFLTLQSVNWCNSWQAYQLHKTKPLQLSMAKQLGANIPQTIVGNISDEKNKVIRSFECIEKPVHGGYLTRKIDTNKLNDNVNLPSTIQSLVKGTNIRTYIIGHFEFSAEIQTTTIDFRSDQYTKVIRTTLPIEVRSLAFRIMKALDMQWTAIDWILDEKSEYVFLEANPAPMFVEFEKATGYPITESIISMLTTTQDK